MEKKIEALPSLSLEEFQEKKKQQRTKKKKIPQKLSSNFAKRNNAAGNSSNNSNKSIDDNCDMQEDADKAMLVGSQKRKARKQSITRNAAAPSATAVKEDDHDVNKRKYIFHFFLVGFKIFNNFFLLFL